MFEMGVMDHHGPGVGEDLELCLGAPHRVGHDRVPIEQADPVRPVDLARKPVGERQVILLPGFVQMGEVLGPPLVGERLEASLRVRVAGEQTAGTHGAFDPEPRPPTGPRTHPCSRSLPRAWRSPRDRSSRPCSMPGPPGRGFRASVNPRASSSAWNRAKVGELGDEGRRAVAEAIGGPEQGSVVVVLVGELAGHRVDRLEEPTLRSGVLAEATAQNLVDVVVAVGEAQA